MVVGLLTYILLTVNGLLLVSAFFKLAMIVVLLSSSRVLDDLDGYNFWPYYVSAGICFWSQFGVYLHTWIAAVRNKMRHIVMLVLVLMLIMGITSPVIFFMLRDAEKCRLQTENSVRWRMNECRKSNVTVDLGVEAIQSKLKCCGFDGKRYWDPVGRLPPSCCPKKDLKANNKCLPPDAYGKSCKDALNENSQYGNLNTMSVSLWPISEFFIFFIGCCLLLYFSLHPASSIEDNLT